MNKFLHTVASVGFLFTLNYDSRTTSLKDFDVLLSVHLSIITVTDQLSAQILVL